jgi:hypothetical protein
MICAGEFAMADEAFALSPISARAAQPREEDYEAIREAFMETSRGRWFLGEYAKRNRNADTRMVLDAVARIEETLAAQKPASDSELAEALGAIRSALGEARHAAAGALDRLALEENLAPVRKGARVIREIAWRWREIGADGRICDLLDSQVGAIEGACGKLSSAGPRNELNAVFDLIEQRIAELGDGDAGAPQAAEKATRPAATVFPGPSDEMPAAASQTMQAESATGDADAATGTAAMPAEAAPAQSADMTFEAAEATAETSDVTAEAADAYDEAVLDMIALEMAAPDPSDAEDASETGPDQAYLAEPPPADPIIVAREPEPMAAPAQPPAVQPSLERSPERSLERSPERSLGSTLIANGIVRRPNALQSDPLAPIRRLSQAEKIALFS